jgi:FkbM family methyltransferase
VRYTGNLNNFIDRAVFFYGAHEREAMIYMGSRINPGDVVLDIGANVGHHSLFFSTKAQTVHSFEPNPNFRRQFEQLMHINNVTNVTLHQIGLGDSSHNAHYYAPTGDNQGIGSFVFDHHITNKDIGVLPIMKGDDVVDSLGLQRVDFIKIDVERFEKTVLQGLQKTIKKFKPIIVLEYGEADFASREKFLSLTEGYTPYILKVNANRFFLFNNSTCKPVPFNFDQSGAEMLLEPSMRLVEREKPLMKA